MKKPLLIIILSLPLFVIGQQKADILNQIIKINMLQTEDKGPGVIDTNFMSLEERKEFNEIPNKYDNYKNFQALTKIITHSELVELTNNKNGVVRLFAIRQLVKERDYNFNFFNFFLNEFDKKDFILSRFADMIDSEATYSILLQDFSGDWNYARSTGEKTDSKFLNHILRPIDSFILFNNFEFDDATYEDVFDRQKFEKSANGTIVELIKNEYNFWAFNYLRKNDPELYRSIKKATIAALVKNKKTVLNEHPQFYEWFLRYLITSHQYNDAKSLLQELNERDYSKETVDFMLTGIDKKLIDRVR